MGLTWGSFTPELNAHPPVHCILGADVLYDSSGKLLANELCVYGQVLA